MGLPYARFYDRVLKLLQESEIPFLVGGGYALNRHTALDRPARDLDVFVLPADAKRVLRFFSGHGYRTQLTYPHWLGKIYKGKGYVDIIFSSGNGVATVDPLWFEHGVDGNVLGHSVKLTPAEEMIWSKAFVMERDRFDGADVIRLFLARGSDLDWRRLNDRFREFPLVLLSHLTLFLFAFPSEVNLVPSGLWEELWHALEAERRHAPRAGRICRGTLLSREQYLDLLAQGFRDARLAPDGMMQPKDVNTWTKAIGLLSKESAQIVGPHDEG